MRPARRFANLCDAVATFGSGFWVVGLTDEKVLLRAKEGIPQSRSCDMIEATANRLGLKLSWNGRCGVVARRVRWLAGTPVERPSPHV